MFTTKSGYPAEGPPRYNVHPYAANTWWKILDRYMSDLGFETDNPSLTAHVGTIVFRIIRDMMSVPALATTAVFYLTIISTDRQ